MKTKSLKELFKDDDEGKIVLPNFQRDFVWDIKQQKELLATFLVELPISSILLLRGNPDDFNYRKLCYTKESKNAKDDCFYLLDGQQRMSTLKSIFYNFFKEDWENEFNNLYNKLRNLWFLKIKPSDEEDFDNFGYKKLYFENENLKNCTPQEVIDNIVSFGIKKTRKDLWYHPEYKFKENFIELQGAKRERAYIKKCAEEFLVPLNGLSEDKNKVLRGKILAEIASDRIEEIFCEIEDERNKELKLKKIKEYFTREDLGVSIEKIEDFEEEKESLKATICAEWKAKVSNFLENLLKQEISLIEIEKNEISRGIAIFESINKGGTPLDNFDLIAAKSAKESTEKALAQRIIEYLKKDIALPDVLVEKLNFSDIKNWNVSFLEIIKNEDEINKRIKNQYLNLLSIFYHIDKNFEEINLSHIKREKIFEIYSKGINTLTEKTIKSIVRALSFINIRLGITEFGEFSFELIILPIAYLLSNDEIWTNKIALNKIEYWYWTSIFTGRYREKQNSRVIEDFKTLCKWVLLKDKNDKKVLELLNEKLERVLNTEDYSDYNTLINSSKTPISVEKGLLNYIFSTNPYDFLPNQRKRIYEYVLKDKNFNFEDHHLIPLGSYKKIKESSEALRKDKEHILNSVLNRAKISKQANRDISDLKLDEYMKEVNEICRISYCISADLSKKETENNEEYYKRLIEDRYKRIREKLLEELHSLKEENL